MEQEEIESERVRGKNNRRDYDENAKFGAGLSAVREINCQGKIFF